MLQRQPAAGGVSGEAGYFFILQERESCKIKALRAGSPCVGEEHAARVSLPQAEYPAKPDVCIYYRKMIL